MKLKLYLVVVLPLVAFFVSGTVFAMTDAEKQALIAQIQAQIVQIRQQIIQMQGTAANTSADWCYTFDTTIQKGDTGVKVAALQIALQKEGLYITPAEAQSQTFGDYTFIAVKDFQEKYASEILAPLGLSRGTGKVAAKTIAKLNQLYRCSGDNSAGNNDNIVCAQDAKQCSDGSYVARVAPNCEFATCPITICSPFWQFGQWSACVNSQQTRTATDLNNCGAQPTLSMLMQSCVSTTPTCAPSWQTGSWSACANGSRTRTATDSNNCGVTSGRPSLTESCTAPCNATCLTQTDGIYAVDCSERVTKCASGKICQKTYDTSHLYIGGAVQTTQTLTGAQCVTAACAPSWQTGSWSVCANSQQTRTVTDSNNCGVTTDKPATTQSCSLTTTCTPNWTCGWGLCVNGYQSQISIDSNNCGLPSSGANIVCTALARVCTSTPSATLPPTVDIKAWLGSREDLSDGPIFVSKTVGGVFLQWTSSNADSCTASGGWTGTKNTTNSAGFYTGNQGANVIPMTSSQTYTIACTGAGGTATDSVVVNPTAEFLVDIKVNNSDGPITVNNGGSANLTWVSANASSCTLTKSTFCVGCNPDYETKDIPETIQAHKFPYSSKAVTLAYNRYTPKAGYTFTCKDSNGNSKSDTVVINISATNAPTVVLKANEQSGATTLQSNQPLNLTWSSTGANTCTASGDWSGPKSTTGSETITLPDSSSTASNYSLSCTGATGTVKSSVAVSKIVPPITTTYIPPGGGGGGYLDPNAPKSCGYGQTQDAKGNCITPPPPIICPAGQTKDANGKCITPPPSPVRCFASCARNVEAAIGCDGKSVTMCGVGQSCMLTYTTKYYVYGGSVGVTSEVSGSKCYTSIKY